MSQGAAFRSARHGAPAVAAAVVVLALLAVAWLLWPSPAWAHGVDAQDAAAVGAASGYRPWVFAYLGAKHMVTGVDHLLFLAGVVCLLQRWRDVAVYASLFALGHSVSLVAGVLLQWRADEHLVDALIGLSIVYKALDNQHAFETFFGHRPPPRLCVALFGLVHGLGLAGRLQSLALSEDGLLGNLLAFNVGVEFGQLLALGGIVAVLACWRQRAAAPRLAHAAQLGPAAQLAHGAQLAPAAQQAHGALLAYAARPAHATQLAHAAQLALFSAGLVLALEQLGAWSMSA